MDRIIRSRQRPIVEALEWAARKATDPKASFVGQVVSGGSIPTTGQKYCLVNPTDVSGPETEGGALTLTVDTSRTVVVAMIVGVPAVGDYLIVEPEGNRWVAEKIVSGGGGGGGTGTIPGCSCTPIPAVLNMTSADETCDFGMFRTGTISYQARPAAYASLHTLDPGYYGDQDWIDGLTGSTFRYYLTCFSSQFSMTRIYAVSPYGSPYEDGILYTWLGVGSGSGPNTCSPFSLNSGTPYTGSACSPSSPVTITG